MTTATASRGSSAPPMKRWCLLAISVLVAAAFVESALRLWILHLPVAFLIYLNPRLRDSSPEIIAKLHDAVPTLSTRRPDPDTGWTYPPNTDWNGKNEDGEPYSARTSPEGFFTPDLPEKSQHQLILLGDSYLATFYVRRPMPNVIRDALGIPTYSLAVGGWGPESYIAGYRKFAAERRHDLVIVTSFVNDITDVDNWHRWQREQRSESFLMWIRRSASQDIVNLGQSWADTHLVFWNLARFAFNRPVRSAEERSKKAALRSGAGTSVRLIMLAPVQGPTLEHYNGFDLQLSPGYSFMVHDPEDFFPGGNYDEYIAAYLDSLLRLKAAIEANHARMVLVWIPSQERVYLPRLSPERQAAYVTNRTHDISGIENVLHRFADSVGLDFLDLVEPFSGRARAGEKLYFTIDGHLNSHGNEVAGELIAEFTRHLPAPLPSKNIDRPQLLTTEERAIERPLSPSTMVDRANIVRLDGDSWTARGTAAAQYSYLARWPESTVEAPQRLLLKGVLRRGGFTVGLLKNDRWALVKNITTAGPFELMLVVRDSGRYEPVLANCLPAGSLENDFDVASFGWAVVREMEYNADLGSIKTP